MKNKTINLFQKKANLNIYQLQPKDIIDQTDYLKDFKNLILEHEDMYPKIDKWFKNKVTDGIINKERIAYIGYSDDKPLVSSVVKRGVDAKFCHLNINENNQDSGIGDLFFSLMTLSLRHQASSIHFTLPENLWEQRKEFFKSFGFRNISKSNIQYRTGVEELRNVASFNDVWKNTLTKLPKIISNFTFYDENIFSGILMSIKPEYLKLIEDKDKYVEIRRSFHTKWENHRVTLYSSSPSQAIQGYATIKNVNIDTPKNIWDNYETKIGCTKKEFETYTSGTDKIYAITLENFNKYEFPVLLTQLQHLLGKDLRPPQSYQSIKNNKRWQQAISISEMLHNRFPLYT